MIPSYPSTGHWPQSQSVHREDRYHRDPTFFVGKPVVITEKLDGGITQFAGGRIYARSSSVPTHEPWFSYVKSVTLPKLYAMPPHLMAGGEDLYAIHSIEYDPLPDSFFLFYVLDREIGNINTEHTENDQYCSWKNVLKFAEQYGLLTVPVLYEGVFEKVEHITEFFYDHIGQPSVYGPIREGFVLRTAGSFAFDKLGLNMCKFVRANHVQTDEHWKKNWRPARIVGGSRDEPEIMRV